MVEPLMNMEVIAGKKRAGIGWGQGIDDALFLKENLDP